MDKVQGPQIEDALLTFLVFVAGMMHLPESMLLWIAYPLIWWIIDIQQYMVPPTDEDIDTWMGIKGYSEARRKWIEEERRRKK